MHGIDRYAWANAIVDVDPLQKASLAGVALLLCLTLNEWVVSLATIGWMTGVALLWARLPVRAILSVLAGEFFFLVLSTLGLLISIGDAPTAPVLVALPIGATWVYVSWAALWLAAQLTLRALGCATAMSFLALTTPLVDLIELLRRLRLPGLLIDLMTISYRSIFVLLASIERTYRAQDSRLGYRNAARTWVSASSLGSRIFLETFRRTQQLGLALESRGYAGGALRVLPTTYRRTHQGWLLLTALVVTLGGLFLLP
jgi:cobalt/nickel transport system permease protein